MPPFIFPHRAFVERDENELKHADIEAKFGGGGGRFPALDGRWCTGQLTGEELVRMGISDRAYGKYYGFRTRDDQMLFYMLFEGKLRKA